MLATVLGEESQRNSCPRFYRFFAFHHSYREQVETRSEGAMELSEKLKEDEKLA